MTPPDYVVIAAQGIHAFPSLDARNSKTLPGLLSSGKPGRAYAGLLA
jgi:hypothetical protein